MHTRLVCPARALAALVALGGCAPDAEPAGGSVGGGEDAATPSVSYTWGSGVLSFRVWGDEGAQYLVGLTESGPDLEAPRTEEDCGDPDAFCHLAPEGQEVLLDYGGDPDRPSPGATAFSLDSNDQVTWVVRTQTWQSCWVWGADVAVYAGDGCAELVEE